MTSKESADDIINNEFIINRSRDNEWLGYGIYFFEHLVDAVSWATTTYYCKKEPTLIKCEISTNVENFLNLDNPEEMDDFQLEFDKCLKLIAENGKELIFKSDKHAMHYGLNLYKEQKSIELIKYTFQNPRTRRTMKYTKLYNTYTYNEVQLCATSNNPISSKIIVQRGE